VSRRFNELTERFDLAVVGAGILGLATALAGARQGLRVVVIDRDAQANGASVRNFGFITVSGQESGVMWARARRSRDVWSEVAQAASIPVLQSGLWVTARRPEAVAVMEAFMATDMAEGCSLLSPAEARRRCPQLLAPDLAAVMVSTLELRVESRLAIPRLAAWLTEAHGVRFMRNTTVQAIEVPTLHTSSGRIQAERIAVCPGDDFTGLYAERLKRFGLTRCKLQMLRLADPGFKLPASLMSDLGLVATPVTRHWRLPLLSRLASPAEQPDHLEHGVHLIVVQAPTAVWWSATAITMPPRRTRSAGKTWTP
jgi:FAD dependent oxidoreductase TIGR03364